MGRGERGPPPRRGWSRGLAAALLLGACDASPPCPSGLHEDPARARQLLALLAALPETAPLLTGPTPQLCFGQPGEGVLGEDGALRLSGEGPPAEEAARLAHLLQHHKEGPPLSPPDGRPCEARVRAAMEAERQAYALEARARRALGVMGPAPPPSPALEEDYRRRCAEAARTSSRPCP